MNNALIGFSGFVGSTLLKQASFESLYRSTNINDIRGREFDTVVCAGAPAQKWLANKDPQNDLMVINNLIENLKTVTCKTFILISTVDVFKTPQNINEDSPVNTNDLHPYGLHRHYLEQFVAENYQDYLIIRLPGLVGPGLKKNIIFDFLNNNNTHMIESRNIFQFYPMVNLWSDINTALAEKLKLVHLTAEPISVSELAEKAFDINFNQPISSQVISYDMQTKYALLFGGVGNYQYSKRETILATRSYKQSEPLTKPIK